MPNSDMMQSLFNTYEPYIVDPGYLARTPVELLSALITAIYCLKSNHIKKIEAITQFINRTTMATAEDLTKLSSFADQVTQWRDLEICSTYTNATGSFVEFKLKVLVSDKEKIIHRHALYQQRSGQWCFISQSRPLVRIIGDPILHQPGHLFPTVPTMLERAELDRQIQLAKSILITTCGGGIAANQCAAIESPYQFAIVGIFKEVPAHVEGIERRYPGANFPPAMIMVNPKIISQSSTMQRFKHACLSVPSPNRCEVHSPQEMTVEYLDPMNNMAPTQALLKGTEAVALWHEMNHILDGKTYIDTVLASLTPEDLAHFEDQVSNEMLRRQEDVVTPELTVPPFHFSITINTLGVSVIDRDELERVLPKFTTETLEGFLARCKELTHQKISVSEATDVRFFKDHTNEIGLTLSCTPHFKT